MVVTPVLAASTHSLDNRVDTFGLRLDGVTEDRVANASRALALPLPAAEADTLRRSHSAAASQALEGRLPGLEAGAAGRGH